VGARRATGGRARRDRQRGGDADTNAAIAGGALGAAQGLGALPERWTARLEYAAELRALAPRLATLRGAS
jgi:ADP-ribosylglycohydrolase